MGEVAFDISEMKRMCDHKSRGKKALDLDMATNIQW